VDANATPIVDLVADKHRGALHELLGVGLELGLDRSDALDRVALVIAAREVDDVQDDRGAFDVPQERVSESQALARTFDEPGDVRHHVAVLARLHHAEVRHERGERVVGDLGARRGHTRDERGFPHAGEPDERGVSQELQLERDPALLARFTELRERRGTPGRRDEMSVAASAMSAFGDHRALARVREVGDDASGLVVADDRAERDLEFHVLAHRTVHAAALAVRAARGLEVALELVVDERGGLRVRHEHDSAAPPAVAAVGAALGHVLLTSEGGAPGAAVPRCQMYACLVDEHLRSHHLVSLGAALMSGGIRVQD
jgi:hypothetical protein